MQKGDVLDTPNHVGANFRGAESDFWDGYNGSFEAQLESLWGLQYHLVMTNIAMENHHAINR